MIDFSFAKNIYISNYKTIKLVNNLIFSKRTKHLVVKYHHEKNLIN
jgi:hypothetical protein